MKKMYDGEIPFEVGNGMNRQLHYPESWRRNEIIWKPNQPFSARLKFDNSYGRGRSAAYFYATLHYVDSADKDYALFLENKEVTIFMTDLANFLVTMEIRYGETSKHEFAFSKRGMNYGLTLLKG